MDVNTNIFINPLFSDLETKEMIKEIRDAVLFNHDTKLKPSLEDNHDTKLEHTKNSNSEETQQKLRDLKIEKNKGNKKTNKNQCC